MADDDGGHDGGGPRRREDEARVERILADPDGPEWEKLQDELVGYAHRRIEASIRNGTIYGKAAKANRGRPVAGLCRVSEGLVLAGHDATVLADNIVASAVRSFRNTGLRSWDPDGGRSLKSYFFTCCLFKFPDSYRSWQRREAPLTPTHLPLDTVLELAGSEISIEDEVVQRDLIRRAAERHPEAVRIVLLSLEGFSLIEIRAQLGEEGGLMSDRKMKRLLAELREWLQGEESAE